MSFIDYMSMDEAREAYLSGEFSDSENELGDCITVTSTDLEWGAAVAAMMAPLHPLTEDFYRYVSFDRDAYIKNQTALEAGDLYALKENDMVDLAYAAERFVGERPKLAAYVAWALAWYLADVKNTYGATGGAVYAAESLGMSEEDLAALFFDL